MDVPDGTNVRKLLEILAAKHGVRLKEYLFDKAENPRSYLQFILNEKSISEIGGFETVLTDGCAFAIIPPVGGG